MKDTGKSLAGVAAATVLTAALVLPGCAQVTSAGDTPTLEGAPETTQAAITTTVEETATAPEVVMEGDLAQMVAAFEQDPEQAAAEYGGKRFVFRDVVAEDISSLYKPINPDTHVLNGNIKFRPEYASLLTDLQLNSVMDIEGTVVGMQLSYIIVSDCTYNVTDTSNARERPDFQYTFE